MRINLATELSVSNTGCCLEIGENMKTYGFLFASVVEKGVSKEEDDGCKRLGQQ